MIFNRKSFFLSLFIVMVLPLPLYKMLWLATSRQTIGTMYFIGHGNLGSVFGISTYPVIWFIHGKDTIYFNSNVNIPLKPEEKISVRYQRNDPTDARINYFSSIWGDTLAYDLAPLLIFLVMFLHPDLVPRKAKIVLGKKPVVKILEL
jgi:hypothetical protein